MSESRLVIDADAFVRRVKLVTLDTVLDEQEAISVAFEQLSLQAEASRGWLIRMNGWADKSKPELLDLARERGRAVRASDSKTNLLAEVVESYWMELDAAAAFRRAQDANDDLRRWARRLRELPERLQDLIRGAEQFFEREWAPKQDTLYNASSAVRWNALKLMELEWVATEAQQALKELEQGRTHAEVVHMLAKAVQMAIMGVLGANLHPTGTGLEHMAHVEGARLLTKAFYGALPEEMRPFLATIYS